MPQNNGALGPQTRYDSHQPPTTPTLPLEEFKIPAETLIAADAAANEYDIIQPYGISEQRLQWIRTAIPGREEKLTRDHGLEISERLAPGRVEKLIDTYGLGKKVIIHLNVSNHQRYYTCNADHTAPNPVVSERLKQLLLESIPGIYSSVRASSEGKLTEIDSRYPHEMYAVAGMILGSEIANQTGWDMPPSELRAVLGSIIHQQKSTISRENIGDLRTSDEAAIDSTTVDAAVYAYLLNRMVPPTGEPSNPTVNLRKLFVQLPERLQMRLRIDLKDIAPQSESMFANTLKEVNLEDRYPSEIAVIEQSYARGEGSMLRTGVYPKNNNEGRLLARGELAATMDFLEDKEKLAEARNLLKALCGRSDVQELDEILTRVTSGASPLSFEEFIHIRNTALSTHAELFKIGKIDLIRFNHTDDFTVLLGNEATSRGYRSEYLGDGIYCTNDLGVRVYPSKFIKNS